MSGPSEPLLIVGAGPNGLAVAWAARQRGIEALIVERGQQAGGAWPKMWPQMRCLSARHHDVTPDDVVSAGEGHFATASEVATQWQLFAQRQRFHITFGVHAYVQAMNHHNFTVAIGDQQVRAQRLVAATGEFDTPQCRSLAADPRRLPIGVIHVRDLQAQQLVGTSSLLVVGAGNSAAQVVAAGLASGATVTLCAKALPSRVTPWRPGRLATLRWHLSGLELPAWALQSRCQNRAPLLDPQLVEQVARGAVRHCGSAAKLLPNGVVTATGETVVADLVVLATGYDRELSWMAPSDGAEPATIPAQIRAVSTRWRGLGFAGLACSRTLRSGFLRGAKGDAIALVDALLRQVPA
ncbi:MAG: hypothetical protein EXR77_08400 [Myxococcales bacterium]|nr:hypothetical protein [Myxococcales bacterium]